MENTELYEVNIDFVEAHNEWLKNKFYLGGGYYIYVCAKRGINNNICISKCLEGEIYCKTHFRIFLEENL